MPEEIKPEPREGLKNKQQLEELTRIVKLLVKAVIHLEENVDEYSLPKGDYFGITVE